MIGMQRAIKHHYIIEIGAELAYDISLRCNSDFPSGSWEVRDYNPFQALSFILWKRGCSPALDMAWARYEAGDGICIIDREDVSALKLPAFLRGMHHDVVERAHLSTMHIGPDDVEVFEVPRPTKKDYQGQLALNL